MGVRLSELTSGVRTLVVPFGEHKVRVSYRLGERTPEATNEAGDLLGSVVPLIIRLVASWDITDDDGNAVPVTEEHVSKVPMPVLRRIFLAIWGDDGLGEAPSTSDAG